MLFSCALSLYTDILLPPITTISFDFLVSIEGSFFLQIPRTFEKFYRHTMTIHRKLVQWRKLCDIETANSSTHQQSVKKNVSGDWFALNSRLTSQVCLCNKFEGVLAKAQPYTKIQSN